MKTFAVLCAVTLLVSLPAAARAKDEPMTANAVTAADDSWLDAEIRGDGNYLAQLLLDGYVSIGSSGSITTKQQIVDRATKRGPSEQFAKKVAEWKVSHPAKASVALFGDTAILTWNSVGADSAAPVRSCDVFVYRDGHWHAIYSQHTALSN